MSEDDPAPATPVRPVAVLDANVLVPAGLRDLMLSCADVGVFRPVWQAEIEDEVAAVIVPSLAKAGRSCGILSGRPLSGCSSCSTVTSPLRVEKVTGTTSPSKAPLSIAALARRSDSIEYSSICSRVS